MAFPPKLITNYQSAATHQQQADEIIAGHARSAGAGEGVGGILLGVQDDDVCAVHLCICLDGVALRAVSILEQIAWRIARDRFFHRPIVVGVAVAVGNRKIRHAALPVVGCVDFEQQTACPVAIGNLACINGVFESLCLNASGFVGGREQLFRFDDSRCCNGSAWG